MKSVKWSSLFIAVCYIGAGVLFFMYPESTKQDICMYGAYAALLIGSLNIIGYFLRPKQEAFFRNDFIVGLLLITFGVITITTSKLFLDLVYIALAIVIMLSGYKKLQDSVDSWRLGYSNGFLYLILAVISIAIGTIIIIHGPKMKTLSLDYMIGAGFLYSGISDFISSVFLSVKMSGYIKELKEKAKEIAKEKETVIKVGENNEPPEIKVDEFEEEPIEENKDSE